jgi:protein-histidine N-methyltransferase
MAEADDDTDTLLAGLENGDLTSGIYEGGFKTWECSLDLASLVVTDLVNFTTQNWHVVELGAGSAVPSLVLLQASFPTSTSKHSQQQQQQQRQQRQRQQGTRWGGSLRFTLCDYNEDVLRLCTAPNVLLNHYYHQHHQMREPSEQLTSASPSEEQQEEEGDLDIEELGGETFVADTIRDLGSQNISFDFISGGWGDSFLDLVPTPNPKSDADADADVPSEESLLILASETIYSPASIKVFAETLVSLLRRYPRGMAKAWVAAKKVYFGVGGGVDDFLRDIGRHGAKCTTLLETKDTGVGRVVLEITV